MADIKAQLKSKNGDNLYPVTSMAYVTATFNGGLSFNSSTNTLSTYRIPIASVSALTTSLSAKQATCSAGFRTEINGATVGQMRYFDIAATHSSGALTLSAGQAYRIFATGNVVTLNAETFNTTQFGLEGHATILVTNNSYLTLGSNVVLGTPLVNDAVNNCTLRFHDGHCIIDVEDHDAAHTVTVATGTGSGTLYYYCSAANTTTNETPQFISISDALDGGLVSFNSVSVNGEKHIAGNGIERTSLTSSFTPSSRTYITHATFNNMTALTGGTVYATDCAVVAGGTATFSSPVYAYEKLAVNGTLNVPGRLLPGNGIVISGNNGAINLSATYIGFSNGAQLAMSGCVVSGGSCATTTAAGGAFYVTNGAELNLVDVGIDGSTATSFGAGCAVSNSIATLTSVHFSGNSVTHWGGAYAAWGGASTYMHSCTFTDNKGSNGAGMHIAAPVTLSACTFSGGSSVRCGAGVEFYGDAEATISDCNFISNTVAEVGGAIGVYGYSNTVNVYNCVFSGNIGQHGAAVGIRNGAQGVFNLSNCQFVGNSTTTGNGVIYEVCAKTNASNMNLSCTNCTVSGNQVNNDIVYMLGGEALFSSCTLIGNKIAANGAMTFYLNGLSNTLIDCVVSGNTAGDISYTAYGVAAVDNTIISNCTICKLEGTTAAVNKAIWTYAGKTVTLIGSNKIDNIGGNGTVLVSSGAIIDLTNTEESVPISPVSGVTFKPGSAIVYTSGGSSYAFGGFSMSFLPNTNTMDLGTSHLIVPIAAANSCYASNFVFSGGSTTNFGRQILNQGHFIAIDCTFSGGANGRQGTVTNMSGGKCTLRNCTFVNTTNGSPAGFFHYQNKAGGSTLLEGCNFVSVGADRQAAKYTNIYGTDTISNCVFASGQKITVDTGATVRLAGSNVIAQIDGSGNVIVSSGGVIDLTGNAIETPIAPGGGISIETGGCTIINSAGTSVAIAAGTYTQINKDGTTA